MNDQSRNHMQESVKSRIDSRAQIIDPIDFSFKDLMSLEGKLQIEIFIQLYMMFDKSYSYFVC